MSNPGPNPQTNLILSIVFPVVALIAIAVVFFTKPVPAAPGAPTAINTQASKLPNGEPPYGGVTIANQLPSGGGNGGGAAAGGGSRGGGKSMPPMASMSGGPGGGKSMPPMASMSGGPSGMTPSAAGATGMGGGK
jgi:hypothetical protein